MIVTTPSSTKLYYSISEVSQLTGLKQHVLRYWESEFPLLNPKKNRAGNRAYRSRDIKIVLLVKRLLYDEEYTIDRAKQKLKSDRRFVESQLKLSLEELQGPLDILAQVQRDLQSLLRMVEEL